jgi:hypothetical protein
MTKKIPVESGDYISILLEELIELQKETLSLLKEIKDKPPSITYVPYSPVTTPAPISYTSPYVNGTVYTGTLNSALLAASDPYRSVNSLSNIGSTNVTETI